MAPSSSPNANSYTHDIFTSVDTVDTYFSKLDDLTQRAETLIRQGHTNFKVLESINLDGEIYTIVLDVTSAGTRYMITDKTGG